MAPIEHFPSSKMTDGMFGREKDFKYGWDEISSVVRDVFASHGFQEKGEVKDTNSTERYLIGVAGSENDAYPVVLIGHDVNRAEGLSDPLYPHTLIAPQEIIDEVNDKLKNLVTSS